MNTNTKENCISNEYARSANDENNSTFGHTLFSGLISSSAFDIALENQPQSIVPATNHFSQLPFQQQDAYKFSLSNNIFDAETDIKDKLSNIRSLDVENALGPNSCVYCRRSRFKTVEDLKNMNFDQINSVFDEQFECTNCGQLCHNLIGLIVTIKNRFISHELKARMLWESYFQEIPDEDFVRVDIPKWKQSSLDLSKPIFFSKNKISINVAVGIIFNKDNFEKPAWSKRYFLTFQQWLADYPNVNHNQILISSALEMGIEQIRYHSSSEVFFSREGCYILIDDNSNIAASGITTKNNCETVDSELKTELTHQERIELVRGINFIGKGNWQQILSSPGLRFSKTTNVNSLKNCSTLLEKHLKIISFSGKLYRVIPEYELNCIEPIPTFEQFNDEEPLLSKSYSEEIDERIQFFPKKIKISDSDIKRKIISGKNNQQKMRTKQFSVTPQSSVHQVDSANIEQEQPYYFNLCYNPDENDEDFKFNEYSLESSTVKIGYEEILKIINDIYEDDGPYFINILRKIPTSFIQEWKHTWATMARYFVTATHRSIPKWNALKNRLLSLDLIEEGEGKIVIRKFDFDESVLGPLIPDKSSNETDDNYLIELINNIYDDDTAGVYYLNVIRKIPTSFEDGRGLTWAAIPVYHVTRTRRITKKWNQLKQLLLSMNIIEEGERNVVIRKFI